MLHYDLSTKVKTKAGESIAAMAACRCSNDNAMSIEVYPNTVDKKKLLGTAKIVISRNGLPTMSIEHMENKTLNTEDAHQYIGSALHEAAFRLSIDMGCEGRITLNAVRDTHLFHFKHGFRVSHHRHLEYYQQLLYWITLMNKANNKKVTADMGSCDLYFPPASIEFNLKKYNLSVPTKKRSVIEDKIQEDLVGYENLIDDALKNGVMSRILYSLLYPREERSTIDYSLRKRGESLSLFRERLVKEKGEAKEEIFLPCYKPSIEQIEEGAKSIIKTHFSQPSHMTESFMAAVIDTMMRATDQSLELVFPNLFKTNEFKEFITNHRPKHGLNRQ